MSDRNKEWRVSPPHSWWISNLSRIEAVQPEFRMNWPIPPRQSSCNKRHSSHSLTHWQHYCAPVTHIKAMKRIRTHRQTDRSEGEVLSNSGDKSLRINTAINPLLLQDMTEVLLSRNRTNSVIGFTSNALSPPPLCPIQLHSYYILPILMKMEGGCTECTQQSIS